MPKNCNHKDKFGNSIIEDGFCPRCKIEFGKQFLNKERNKNKKKKRAEVD